MQRIPIIFTLWPGLPQLWLHGHWVGLSKALAFAAFLQFVLYSTYFDPSLVSKPLLISCWLLCGLIWTVSIFKNDVTDLNESRLSSEKEAQIQKLFCDAVAGYLSGRLDDAERLFNRILRLDDIDLDARMYVATIHRHLGRVHQARRELDFMEKHDEVTKWRFQIAEERKLLLELESELSNADQTNPTELDEDSSEQPTDNLVGEDHSRAA